MDRRKSIGTRKQYGSFVTLEAKAEARYVSKNARIVILAKVASEVRATTGVIILALASTMTFLTTHALDQTKLFGQPRYQIDRNGLVLSASPSWLRDDVAEEILAALRHRAINSILETQAAAKVAEIVRTNCWVASLDRVSIRFPSTIIIEVKYRRPVCLLVTATGFVALGEDGIALPAENIRPEARDYLYRVLVEKCPQTLRIGERIQDGVAIEAARLAAFLGPDLAQRGFRFIQPTVKSHPLEPEEIVFSIFDADGRAILWGHAPGREIPGEISAKEKLQRILHQLEAVKSRSQNTAPFEYFKIW